MKLKSNCLRQSTFLILCIALFLPIGNLVAQQQIDQTAQLLFVPTEVTCGKKHQRGKVPMEKVSICALNVSEAREQYRDSVREEAGNLYTCIKPESCTGSYCELHLHEIKIGTPLTIGDKYVFLERNVPIILECICTEEEANPAPEPTDSLVCGEDDKIVSFKMGRQTMCSPTLLAAKKNYQERITRQAKNLIRCKDAQLCDQDPCELKIKKVLTKPEPIQRFGKFNVSERTVKVKAECPCVESFIPNPQEAFENEFASDSEQWMQQPFPNPANQNLYVPLHLSETPQQWSIVVHNINGQQVLVQQIENLGSGTHQIQLNTTDLPDGLYYTSLYLDQQRIETYPILIQH